MIIQNDSDSIKNYLEDASLFEGGHSDCIVFPESMDELKSFLIENNQRLNPITISGAGTGLTGSRIPLQGSILSLEKMEKVYLPSDLKDQIHDQIDVSWSSHQSILYILKKNQSYSLWCNSTIPLWLIQEVLAKKGWYYPPNPTENNSMIGGNVATNASGSKTFRYGSTRKWINRLIGYLSDGTMIDVPRGKYILSDSKNIDPVIHHILIKKPTFKIPQCKHAAGYFNEDNLDLIDLLIGSEGTLAVFTQVELKIIPKPKTMVSGICFFKDKEKVFDFVEKTIQFNQQHQWNIVSLEYFDSGSLRRLRKQKHKVLIPNCCHYAIFYEIEWNEMISEDSIWNCLEETFQSNHQSNAEDLILSQWFQLIQSYGVLEDMSFYINETEIHRQFRHQLPLAINEEIAYNKKISGENLHKVSTDFAAPQNMLKPLMAYYEAILAKINVENLAFGHIGNNHLHINFLPKNKIELEESKKLYRLMAQKIVEIGGTVAAEHGIGKLKKDYLKIMFSESVINEMKMIKKAFDPHCILNHGNLWD